MPQLTVPVADGVDTRDRERSTFLKSRVSCPHSFPNIAKVVYRVHMVFLNLQKLHTRFKIKSKCRVSCEHGFDQIIKVMYRVHGIFL